MSTLKIKNSSLETEIEIGRWYEISDDFYYRHKCKVVDYGDELVTVDFVECESYEECEYYNDGLKPVLDVTEDTPTLYVVFEEDYEVGDEIPILVEAIDEIILVNDNYGETY